MSVINSSYVCVGCKLTVGTVRLLDTAVVCNVFTLGVDPVEAEAKLRNSVVAVLFDDALSLLDIFLHGDGVPPIDKVSCVSRIQLSTRKIVVKYF